MRTTDDDEDDINPTVAANEGRPAWMTTLKANAEEWLEALPKTLSTPPTVLDPLSRFFGREAWTGRLLLQRVRKDLSDLVHVCDGSMKQTNELRALLTDLNRGNVPPHWAKFKMPRGTSVNQYIADLVARLAQLERIATQGATGGNGIWLGGLFQPEAYITATRQAAAHAQGWSLEQLALSLKIEEPTAVADGFVIEGESALLCIIRDDQLSVGRNAARKSRKTKVLTFDRAQASRCLLGRGQDCSQRRPGRRTWSIAARVDSSGHG